VKRSTDRILTSHTGYLHLPGSPGWRGVGFGPRQRDAHAIQHDVTEAVRAQVDAGIDIVNDGQLGSDTVLFPSLDGVIVREVAPGSTPRFATREFVEFKEFFESKGGVPGARTQFTCVGPITNKGEESVHQQIQYLKNALVATPGWQEAFFAIVAPSWMQEVVGNEYYRTDEEFLYAVADVFKPRYKAIVDAGLILSIDAPDLPFDWELEKYRNPNLTYEEYCKRKRIHAEVNNYAIDGLPADRVRLHTCWGSWSAPHMYAIPLQEIIEIILLTKAQCISIEAAKPNHIHEWKVWQDIEFPEDKILMPGVIDHTTDVREHPEEIADRIIRYANIVGRENVIAGTDCGMRGHPQRDWAKYQAMVEGAAIATKKLWRK